MPILALETSTDAGSCALRVDGVTRVRHCPAGRAHSGTLLPLVRELLAEAGIGSGDLAAVAFGAGPGAFTGLRVACGLAQGLAMGAGCPVLPVSTLAAMAAASGSTQVLTLLDARMGEVYTGHFASQGDDWQPQAPVDVQAPEAIVLPLPVDGLIACGNAIAAYPVLATRLTAAGISVRPDIMPDAGSVAWLGALALARGEAIDPALAVPVYIRNKVAKTVAERLQEGGRA